MAQAVLDMHADAVSWNVTSLCKFTPHEIAWSDKEGIEGALRSVRARLAVVYRRNVLARLTYSSARWGPPPGWRC